MNDLLLKQAKTPFIFYSRLSLNELTGCKAHNIYEFLDCMKKVPDASIYHHTHNFLLLYHYVTPAPPSDFAYWVREVLDDEKLGEKLGSIDTIEFQNISDLRAAIVSTIENYIEKNPSKLASKGREFQEFHFIKSVTFAFPTKYVANNLEEFCYCLKKIGIDSIYFHMFEARLRLGKGLNDFSHWIEDGLEEKQLAEDIGRADPYQYTLEYLRHWIIKEIERSIS
jgi:Family of unknown function (DUF5752)